MNLGVHKEELARLQGERGGLAAAAAASATASVRGSVAAKGPAGGAATLALKEEYKLIYETVSIRSPFCLPSSCALIRCLLHANVVGSLCVLQLKQKTPEEVKLSLFRDSSVAVTGKKRKQTLVDGLWAQRAPAVVEEIKQPPPPARVKSSVPREAKGEVKAAGPVETKSAAETKKKARGVRRLDNPYSNTPFQLECTRSAQVVLGERLKSD